MRSLKLRCICEVLVIRKMLVYYYFGRNLQYLSLHNYTIHITYLHVILTLLCYTHHHMTHKLELHTTILDVVSTTMV